jgi:hypothetical protein
MTLIYIIVENGEAYPDAYPTYKAAVAAVKYKHYEELERQIHEVQRLDMVEEILSHINVPESADGKTLLYIEKGINIYVHRMSINFAS